jgi:hypothetical protein
MRRRSGRWCRKPTATRTGSRRVPASCAHWSRSWPSRPRSRAARSTGCGTDSRIDEADDWAIPYIGALVGARPVNALNRGAQRANVGRTILYRRRLGTVRLAELLADDIADWDAVASEAFRRLIRNWHMLDDGPQPGPITRTPQWGFPDLRATRIDSVIDHAHDDVSHYPDVRRHRGVLGRYNISKVNLHLFRQFAFALSGVTPVQIANGLYTLDPSGRDVPLFQVGGREEGDCRAAREWEMRAPIPCRRLNFAGFAPQRPHAPVGLENLLAPIYGRRFATEGGMLEAANAALATDPAPPNALTDAQSRQLIANAMESASPRRNLLPGGDPDTMSIALAIAALATDAPLGPQSLYGANLANWAQDHSPAGWVDALVDPARGRVKLMHALPADRSFFVQHIFYGAFWPVGAGTHDRASGLSGSGFTPVASLTPNFTVPLAGEVRFMDSRTYTPQIAAGGVILTNGDTILSAANGARPYLILRPPAGNTVTIRPQVAGSELTIDGLWIGVFETGATGPTTLLHRRRLAQGHAAQRHDRSRRRARRRHRCGRRPDSCGDPGILRGDRRSGDRLLGHRPHRRSRQRARSGRDRHRHAVQQHRAFARRDAGDQPAQRQPRDRRHDGVRRHRHRPHRRERIAGRRPRARRGPADRLLPLQRRIVRRARAASLSKPLLRRRAAGRPVRVAPLRRSGYAQLSEIAPFEIREGGEHGVEIGAFKRALDPIKRADLTAKLREFLPINAIAQLIFET